MIGETVDVVASISAVEEVAASAESKIIAESVDRDVLRAGACVGWQRYLMWPAQINSRFIQFSLAIGHPRSRTNGEHSQYGGQSIVAIRIALSAASFATVGCRHVQFVFNDTGAGGDAQSFSGPA